VAPGKDLDLRHESRRDLVADEVGQSLPNVERIENATDVAGTILDSDQKNAARGVREGDDGLQNSVSAAETTLELKSLSFRAFEQGWRHP
jgi:hypothetical protein